MKRAHRATGKPKGGFREGAGRPVGATNVLGLGEVAATKACKLRIPDGTTPEAEALALQALQRVVDVMNGKVMWGSTDILRAATHVRAEVCGPVTQKHEHSGAVSISIVNPYADRDDG